MLRELPVIELRPLKELSRYLQNLVEGRLWAKVLLGLFLGIAVGVALGPTSDLVSRELSHAVTSWLALPGALFIRLVQMIMIPLIVSSIIQGIAGGENKSQLRAMGPGVAGYFVATTALAVVIGVGVGTWFQPGAGIDATALGAAPAVADEGPEGGKRQLPEVISGLLPVNPLAAMVSGEMLSVVIFTLIAGIALASMTDEAAAPLMRLLTSIQEVCMTITRFAMKLAPFAVFGLIAQVTARVGLEALTGVAGYVGCVLIALLLLVGFYGIVLRLVASYGWLRFLGQSRDVLLLAFSVASSAAVMPLSLKTAEEKFRVRPSVARFIIPLGATINMNGTAAYQAVAALFLAQAYGIELTMAALIPLIVTTVAASIGTPSTPGAGIVILATILGSIGIPASGIALIVGVDSLLGMCRTAVNVMGDLTATLVFDRRGSTDPESVRAADEPVS